MAETAIKTIKLFLVSSCELEEDRKEFERFINQKNKSLIKTDQLFLELTIWEDFLGHTTQTRMQDEYNKAVKESDLFVMLFSTKIENYTPEEFETAFTYFKKNDRPLIHTYIKNEPVDSGAMNKKEANSLFDFQEKLKELDHFWTEYENVDEVTRKFGEQLDKLKTEDRFKILERNIIVSPQTLLTALEADLYKDRELKDQPTLKHLEALYDQSPLNGDQLLILKRFALLPSTPITEQQLPDFFQIPIDDLTAFNENIRQLCESGWLQKVEQGYLCHQTVHYFIFLKTPPQPEECEAMLNFFTNQLLYEPGESPQQKEEWLPWIRTIIERSASFETDSLASLCNNVSIIYRELGHLEPALEFAVKATDIWEKVLDSNHSSLSISYTNMTLIYKELGRLELALEFAKKNNAILEKTLEPDHPFLAENYYDMAAIYQEQGDLELALKFAKKETAILEKILEPPCHPDLAQRYNNMTMIYRGLGRLELALEFSGKEKTILEQLLEHDHPLIAANYNNIAMISKELGRLDSALKFAEKSTAIREKILDPYHSDLAISYNNMTKIYYDLGRLEDALEFETKAINIWKKTLEPDHPFLATGYNVMAIIYERLGHLELSLEFAKKSTGIMEKILEPDHRDLFICYNNMAIFYQSLGRLQEAEQEMFKAIRILERNFPDGHPALDTSKGFLKQIQSELQNKDSE